MLSSVMATRDLMDHHGRRRSLHKWGWSARRIGAQLANIAKQAKAVLKAETLEAVADRGYFSSRRSLNATRRASR